MSLNVDVWRRKLVGHSVLARCSVHHYFTFPPTVLQASGQYRIDRFDPPIYPKLVHTYNEFFVESVPRTFLIGRIFYRKCSLST